VGLALRGGRRERLSRRAWFYHFATLAGVIILTFPWDLQDHPHWYKVSWLPFVTGIVRPYDLLINAALYFPLGFAIPTHSSRTRVIAAAGLAVVMSGLLEFAQVWSHTRFPSATDLLMNVMGSIAGAVAAGRGLR
jgi:glycopeptide antibiotics resistance protein